MKSPEIAYIEGVKNYKGEIPDDYEFFLMLKDGVSFGEFIEGIVFVYPQTDYAGFHATDTNWFEEGEYKTGILHPDLFLKLEEYFRRNYPLKEDQSLRAVCHYSIKPGRQGFIFAPPNRPNLVIEVSGGEHDSWGQFICCGIPDCESLLQIKQPNQYIQALREIEGLLDE